MTSEVSSICERVRHNQHSKSATHLVSENCCNVRVEAPLTISARRLIRYGLRSERSKSSGKTSRTRARFCNSRAKTSGEARPLACLSRCNGGRCALSVEDASPPLNRASACWRVNKLARATTSAKISSSADARADPRSEEHTSELQS